MRDVAKLALKLLAIAAVAGLCLGATNAVTREPIRQQQILAANAARQAVLPNAAEFVLLTESDGAIADLYEGRDAAGQIAGYTANTLVQGFGGPIEITVGMDETGTVTGVNVGGTDFAETAGLGAKTKEPWFGAQFTGKAGPFALKKDGGQVDAVTSATISSAAVTDGVNAVNAYLLKLLKGGN